MHPGVRGVPRGVGDCVREMRADGRSTRHIALTHGLSLRSVELILEDEYRRAGGGIASETQDAGIR